MMSAKFLSTNCYDLYFLEDQIATAATTVTLTIIAVLAQTSFKICNCCTGPFEDNVSQIPTNSSMTLFTTMPRIMPVNQVLQLLL